MSSSKKYFWENERFMKFLEFLEKMVFAIGIPLSIYTFIDDTKNDREEHDYFVFDSMDKHYRDYEMFAAQYPQLGLSDAVVADTNLLKLVKPDSLFTNDEKIIAKQLMYLLIGLHERAFPALFGG
ncbi:MAG: hypothetical protein HC867_01465 [Bacteroidia bacterium]|nr:hypothetical protein [Bacteroidia bacterium]